MGIVAILKALQAKQEIQRKNLGGEGMATAALVIGIIDIVLWLVGAIFYWVFTIAAI